MAALRRLVPSLGSKARAFAARGAPPAAPAKALKVIVAGACVTAAAAAAYYRSGGEGRVGERLPHLGLPSVSASDKVKFADLKLDSVGSARVLRTLINALYRSFCVLFFRSGAVHDLWC